MSDQLRNMHEVAAEGDRQLEARVRDGKPSFIVTETTVRRFRVWAKDELAAESEVYWMRSSQRPFPNVEELPGWGSSNVTREGTG